MGTPKSVRALFEAALEHTETTRERFIAEACEGDGELLARLQRLLAAHARSGQFIETPAFPRADLTAGGLAGGRIGPYNVVRLLGAGGMGEVYLGERAAGRFPLRVAIKTVRWHVSSDEVERRFRQEATILETLRHPAIARLHGTGRTQDGTAYLVMDYVEGVPLDEHCRVQRLSIDGRLRVVRSVCEAVQHAHDHGIVHRDLKPGNILCTALGEIALLDFGIAKLLRDDEAVAMTRTGQRAMTLEYASPEQITGGAIGPESDVYSLGVVLYELLTGVSPYRAAFRSLAAAVEAVTREPITAPSMRMMELHHDEPQALDSAGVARARRRLAADLDAIVLKALARAPGDRYDSVAALARDLDRSVRCECIGLHAATPSYWLSRCALRQSRWLRRRSGRDDDAAAEEHTIDSGVSAMLGSIDAHVEAPGLEVLSGVMAAADHVLARRPADRTAHGLMAFAANRLGVQMVREGARADALTSFEKAYRSAEAILQCHPGDRAARRSLVGNAWNLGKVSQGAGTAASDTAASRWFEEARHELEAMVELGLESMPAGGVTGSRPPFAAAPLRTERPLTLRDN